MLDSMNIQQTKDFCTPFFVSPYIYSDLWCIFIHICGLSGCHIGLNVIYQQKEKNKHIVGLNGNDYWTQLLKIKIRFGILCNLVKHTISPINKEMQNIDFEKDVLSMSSFF